MRNISKKELKEILELHRKWLDGEDNGKRANLCNVDLSGVDLSGADLFEADLSCADLSGVDLRDANLCNVDLCCANLNGAKLCCANLNGANLYKANLSGANLGGADLRGANLSRAILDNVFASEFTAGYWPVCPTEGEIVGYKAICQNIVKLRIPAEAKRSSATTRKCRCEFAEVLSIEPLDKSGDIISKVGNIKYSHIIIYEVGKMVYPDSFDDDRWNECSHGIHFFMTREEAVNWALQR